MLAFLGLPGHVALHLRQVAYRDAPSFEQITGFVIACLYHNTTACHSPAAWCARHSA